MCTPAGDTRIFSLSFVVPSSFVPVFALLLHVLYRKSGRFYAEHFLFALHFHAFAFLALAFWRFTTTARLSSLVRAMLLERDWRNNSW